MEEKKKSNFEQMAEHGRRLFLDYDINILPGKYGTEFDSQFLYTTFLGQDFRISRDTGKAEIRTEYGSPGCSSEWAPAGPAETMIFYDIFCYGQPDAKASGEYINHNSLVQQLSATANPGEGQYINYIRIFEGKTEQLKAACKCLGGTFLPKGDLTAELPMFDFLRFRFQFWEADDEFPASIVLFMDKNILQFMHYETTWYAAQCILDRIAEEI